jgi:hypothetical protein
VSCRRVRARLSAFLDGHLAGEPARAVDAHLAACPRCAEHLASLSESLAALAELPRLISPEPVSMRVLDRLEMESRSPGLALLFRPAWRARPLIMASLLPAALVFAAALSAAVTLDRARAMHATVASDSRPGTERNPLLPSSGVSVPRLRRPAGSDLVAPVEEGTLFFETVIARDGSVSAVTLLDGDRTQAGPLMAALRRERFEPGSYRGRPVAVSLYRLISRMDVRPPTI